VKHDVDGMRLVVRARERCVVAQVCLHSLLP
jgi:hypothetical protein